MARLYAIASGIQGRDRRTLLTAGSSIVARLVALGVTLATVRISISYLGATRYGLWATITSLTAFLAFSDLGIGNAIINRMALAFSAGERERAAREVSSATLVLGVIALGLIAAGVLLVSILPWSRIYNVTGLGATEAGPATLAMLVCFAFLIPLGLVQKVQLGFQQGTVANLWMIGGALLSLAFLLLAIELKAGLPWLVLGVAGGPVLTTALNWIQEFVFSKPWLRPRPGWFEWSVGIGLARTGLLFLGLQVAAAVAFSSDNLIAAQILGPVAVAQYSVVQRVFMVLPALLSVAAVSLWPAYGEALHRSDRPWIRRTLVRSILLAVGVTGAGSLVILLASRLIFGFLLGPALVPPFTLLLGFLVWSLLYAFGNVASMLLNAANVIVFQLVIASLMAITAIVLKIELGRAYGVSGIIWGTVIAYGLIAVVPTFLYLRRRRRIDW